MLNWAIHGTGFISHAMVTAIAASNCSRVHTIIGRNPETLAEFQTQYAIPNTSSNAAQTLANPEINAVYIALPNHVHHTATIAASNAGKPVLCEKSLTTTIEQANQLATTIRTNNTFFAEGLMYLAHPLYARLTELLLDGRLGKLRAIHGHYAADIHAVTNPLGRGTLFNLGCYPVSLLHLVIQTMCGPDAFANRTLHATGNTEPDHGTVVDATMTCKFANGVLATLQSTDTHGMSHGFTISGENGTLEFITNPWLPIGGDNHIQWRPYKGDPEDTIVNTGHDAFYHQVKMVETALNGGKTQATRPSPTLSDSLDIMGLLTEWDSAILGGR